MITGVYAALRQVPRSESLFLLLNGFGPVIRGIVQQHRFGSVNPAYGWWCYAGRLPVIPLLAAASYALSPSISSFLILKNLVFWPLWIFAFVRIQRSYRISHQWALVTTGILLLAPYNLSIASKVEVEEGFLFALLALAFALLLTLEGPYSALALGVTLAAIYLTKSSMLFVCLAAAVWLGFKHRKQSVARIAIPLSCLVLAIVAWGSFVYAKTGVFAVGSQASSWNGWNFYKGNNPLAYGLYPRVILDVLDVTPEVHDLLPRVPVHNEWELNNAQLALGKLYLRDHPGSTAKMDLKKLYTACCDIGESPETVPGHPRRGVMLSNLVSHLALALVSLVALSNLIRRQASEAEILALLLAAAYMLPYFGGFLYMRHMVPVYGLMAIVAMVQVARWREGPQQSLRAGNGASDWRVPAT